MADNTGDHIVTFVSLGRLIIIVYPILNIFATFRQSNAIRMQVGYVNFPIFDQYMSDCMCETIQVRAIVTMVICCRSIFTAVVTLCAQLRAVCMRQLSFLFSLRCSRRQNC